MTRNFVITNNNNGKKVNYPFKMHFVIAFAFEASDSNLDIPCMAVFVQNMNYGSNFSSC